MSIVWDIFQRQDKDENIVFVNRKKLGNKMRGTFLWVKKNNNNQELCSLISVKRKGRESNFGPSQNLRGWYIPCLQPQKKVWNRGESEIITFLCQDYSVTSVMLLKATKCRWLYLAPFLELLSLFNCGEIVHCCIFNDRQEDKKEADP